MDRIVVVGAGLAGLRAAETLRRVTTLKPDWPEAHNNLGFALGNSGRFKEAIAAHAEALRLKPDYAGALFNLAYAYRKSGDKKQAMQVYQQLVALNRPLADKLYPLIK